MPAGLAAERVRSLLRAGRPGEALAWLAQRPSDPSPAPELERLRAQALLDHGSPVAAAEAFSAVLAILPADGPAALGLAMALGESGRSSDAVAAAERAIASGEDHAVAHYVLGRALLDSHRPDEAEARWRALLQRFPDHAATHESLSELLWMRSGDLAQARHALDAAVRQWPDRGDLRILLARLLGTAGDDDTAAALVEEGIARMPTHVGLRLAAARHRLAHAPALALGHAQAALQAAPAAAPVIAAYADALLANGLAQQAAVLAERLHAANPGDSHALALLATAWRVLDDPRRATLVDYQRYVQTRLIDTPQDWPDLPSYLAALAQELQRLHHWQAHPVDQTLRSGSQVALYPDFAAEPAVRAFPRAIARSIEDYLSSIGNGQDVMGRRNSGCYRYNGMWSVQLHSQGHHLNHFHSRGWISSACYIALPDGVGTASGDGWLTFGAPATPTPRALPPEYLVRPEPGLLVLFPSWMWHGTVPFHTPQQTRLTIAFDLLPG